jgi:UDP-N-acetylmuramoyl-tripeptide--D-alanyl-D-alanine ligase
MRGTWLWPWIVRSARIYRRTLGRRIRVVAVVGSVGKTTTVQTVAAALGVPLGRPALLNMNNPVGVARALLTARPWQRHSVVEAAINGPGQMARHAALLRPNLVVVTAIARDHWRSFGTLEATRDEKAAMVRALRPTGIAVLNADDPNVRWMATQTKARVVLFGESEDAEIRATDIKIDWPTGTSFVVHVPGYEARPVRINLLGKHMVPTALAAIAVAHVEGLSVDNAIATLGNFAPTLSRMEVMPAVNDSYVIRDDYKASSASVKAALATLAEVPATRRIVVLGALTEPEGNDQSREFGRRVAEVADRAIFVGTTKGSRLYRTGARAAGMAPDGISLVHTAHEATELLRNELTAGDVVLTTGRWQQHLARVGLALSGVDVQCRADPCQIKRIPCDICPHLTEPGYGSFAATAAQS